MAESKRVSKQLHLTRRFTDAIDYARHLHIERRKGADIPYLAHLLGVAALVMAEAGHTAIPVTEDMVIAALLHDTVEDHGGYTRLEDLEQNFGPNVARMVKGLTDSFSEDSGDKEPWRKRKEAYIRRLRKEAADVQLIPQLTSYTMRGQSWRTTGTNALDPKSGNDLNAAARTSSGISIRSLKSLKRLAGGEPWKSLGALSPNSRKYPRMSLTD
jgi:hypothetical protein